MDNDALLDAIDDAIHDDDDDTAALTQVIRLLALRLPAAK